MVVGNIDNSVPPVSIILKSKFMQLVLNPLYLFIDKILVGSLQGMMRMYLSSKPQYKGAQ